MTQISGIIAFVLVTAHAPVAQAQSTLRPLAIFDVKTNEFWLNLHHLLYLLGQMHGRAPAAIRDTLRGAPA